MMRVTSYRLLRDLTRPPFLSTDISSLLFFRRVEQLLPHAALLLRFLAYGEFHFSSPLRARRIYARPSRKLLSIMRISIRRFSLFSRRAAITMIFDAISLRARAQSNRFVYAYTRYRSAKCITTLPPSRVLSAAAAFPALAQRD